MDDREFSKLHLRVTIVPEQARWPAPELIHWQKLHEAANEARSRVARFYRLADEIDRNASLSSEAKYKQRNEAATEAIAGFDSSKTMVFACETAERVVGSGQSIRSLNVPVPTAHIT
jgi:hypothetical protein